jgi:hypothetical protein
MECYNLVRNYSHEIPCQTCRKVIKEEKWEQKEIQKEAEEEVGSSASSR